MTIDTVRFQLVLPRWLRDEAQAAAKAKGISMSEFIKDSLKIQLDRERKPKPDAD